MCSSTKDVHPPRDIRSTNTDQLQELFHQAAAICAPVGVQLSIIKEEEQQDFVSGVANTELCIPMMQDTVVQIGSTTKVLNAMMIMSLVEEGKLELDAPVRSYIPELELAHPQALGSITLRHLLSMSSGLDNGDYADYGVGDDAIAKRVAALKTLPQHFKPGDYFGYSNAGVDIAGYVAERVTGRVWDDLLKERIFEPGGFKNAVSLDRDRMFQRVAVGHLLHPPERLGTVVRPWGLSRGSAPAGSTLTMSAHDLAQFGRLFLSGGIAATGRRVISQSSIDAMMRAHISVPVHHYGKSWCLGPFRNEWEGVELWGHHGGNVSGVSFLYWIPRLQGVLACTMACTIDAQSLAVFSRFERLILQQVMRCVFGVGKPDIRPPALPVEINRRRYVGAYDSLAGQCVVREINEQLVMETRWEFTGKFSDTIALIPLGEDRFLIDKGASADPRVMSEDMAFFGSDSEGRATNMLRVVFPSTRNSC